MDKIPKTTDTFLYMYHALSSRRDCSKSITAHAWYGNCNSSVSTCGSGLSLYKQTLIIFVTPTNNILPRLYKNYTQLTQNRPDIYNMNFKALKHWSKIKLFLTDWDCNTYIIHVYCNICNSFFKEDVMKRKAVEMDKYVLSPCIVNTWYYVITKKNLHH